MQEINKQKYSEMFRKYKTFHNKNKSYIQNNDNSYDNEEENKYIEKIE